MSNLLQALHFTLKAEYAHLQCFSFHINQQHHQIDARLIHRTPSVVCNQYSDDRHYPPIRYTLQFDSWSEQSWPVFHICLALGEPGGAMAGIRAYNRSKLIRYDIAHEQSYVKFLKVIRRRVLYYSRLLPESDPRKPLSAVLTRIVMAGCDGSDIVIWDRHRDGDEIPDLHLDLHLDLHIGP